MNKKTTKAEKTWHEQTDGKVLIAKLGKEQEFINALQSAHAIGNGTLGWEGQAKLMYELNLTESLNLKLKGSKKQKIDKIKQRLIDSFIGQIWEYSEWVLPEEAERRHKIRTILYGQDERK